MLRFEGTLLLPLALLECDGPVSNVFSLHLAHRFDIIVDDEQRNKAETLRFKCLFVADDLGALKRGVLFKRVGQDFIVNLIAHVPAENTEVIIRPVI